jgi:hypothetical protein
MIPIKRLCERRRIYPHDPKAPIQVRNASCADVRVWLFNDVWVFRSDSGRVHFETTDPSTVTLAQLFDRASP